MDFSQLGIDDNEQEDILFEEVSSNDIAIIGMSVNLPGAESLEQFWQLLENGDCSVREASDKRKKVTTPFLKSMGIKPEDARYMKIGYIEGIDEFDYDFFRLSPREASLMDPHQRLFLQCVWHAIEDSGYGGEQLRGSNTAVFVGHNADTVTAYKRTIYDMEPSSLFLATPGNLMPVIASRISYLMDFKGPNMVINTACSSSLVAVHYARQAILSGDCDLAIAGGVSLAMLPVESEYRLGMSESGFIRSFDDQGDGIVLGEGAASIILKQLSKAIADGDHIYSIIKGSAVNQDGNSVGITAPNADAQADVIDKAWRNAGINPRTISYIETHGSGTKLGDPIEIEGIQKAFRRYTEDRQFCAIGSVKTNIGHTDSVAGLAGLIKASLSLHNRKLPSSLHFQKPNRNIAFSRSAVYVNTKLREWSSFNQSRKCGVSSFGLSGTNCHVILEEAPFESSIHTNHTEQYHVLTISAKNASAAQEYIEKYGDWLDKIPLSDAPNICYTANVGRTHYRYRVAFIFHSMEMLRRQLTLITGDRWESLEEEAVFAGQSTTSVGQIVAPAKEELDRLTQMAHNMMDEVTPNYLQSLEALCRLYVQGADVPWEKIYRNQRVSRVSIPVYPFVRNHCWLEDSLTESVTENDRHFSSYWVEEPHRSEYRSVLHSGGVLLFKDTTGFADQLAKSLRSDGRKVVEVELSSRFERRSDGGFTVSGSYEDYMELAASLDLSSFSQVVHLHSYGMDNTSINSELFDQFLTYGVYSLFHAVKAFGEYSLPMEWVVVSDHACVVDGSESIHKPENAALYGFTKVIGQEYSNFSCRSIDLDRQVTANMLKEEMNRDFNTTLISYRNGKRWVESLKMLGSNRTEEHHRKVALLPEHVYLITGGMGGIGYEIARYLANQGSGNYKFAFVGRSHWKKEGYNWSNQGVVSPEQSRRLQEIEETGCSVHYFCADVSDEAAMREVLEVIRKDMGPIRGIIHCAGIAGDGFISRKDINTFKQVLLSKTKGTWLLDCLTEKDDLDFFVVSSGIVSLTGMPGQSDYTAANSYLDAFAGHRNLQGKRTLCLNWAAWKETGMAVTYSVNHDSIFKALTTSQAIDSFQFALGSEEARIIVGELCFKELKKWLNELQKLPFLLEPALQKRLEESSDNEPVMPLERQLSTNPVLSGKKEDYSSNEWKVATIWKDILGIDTLNIHDDFFKLGGDSIFAMSIASEIEKAMNISVNVQQIMTYPTVAELAAHIDLNEKTDHSGKYGRVEMESELVRVSSGQQRLYVTQQLNPEDTSYNIPMMIKIEGELDIERLKSVFNMLVKRHESLRTSFEFADDVLMQRFHSQVDFEVTERLLLDSEVDLHVTKYVKPFNLQKAPLIRAELLTVMNATKPTHFLMVDIHHIIADGISVNILCKEFVSLYKGVSLPEVKFHYREYSQWQQEVFYRSEEFLQQEQYWMKTLSGPLEELTLPDDYPTISSKSNAGGKIFFETDPILTEQIRQLSINTKSTLFMIMAAAYTLVLSKYAQQNEVIFGVPVSGRNNQNLESVLGMFANTLVFRNEVDARITWEEFQSRVKQQALEAYANPNYPFERLVRKLGSYGDGTQHPLFNCMLIQHNLEALQFEGHEVTFKVQMLNHSMAKYDITLQFTDNKDDLQLVFEYRLDRFKRETVDAMSRDVLSVLRKVVENPEETLSRILNLKVSAEQKNQLNGIVFHFN
nr:SDR family NAD(P)-dependent oxidoreductase [Paenibacillus xylanexedens]